MRAVLDTRGPDDVAAPLDPAMLAKAATERKMAYARLPLPRDYDESSLTRLGEIAKGLPKPMTVVSPPGGPGGMFTLAHVAIEQGMPGEAMLEAARRLGVLYGSEEIQQKIADFVDRREMRPDLLERRRRAAHRGAPNQSSGVSSQGSEAGSPGTGVEAIARAGADTQTVIESPHQRAVVMHAEVKAIREPLWKLSHELAVQVAGASVVVGLLGALLVDRRLLLITLAGVAYVVGRAWPHVKEPVVTAASAAVPDKEVALLRARLEKLRAA
ncbi:MAG: hypothetical protein JO122_12935 [Acetobacteraceae bacterium]|nr:hypothetical protein [Acetobacteraceae bacterium]